MKVKSEDGSPLSEQKHSTVHKAAIKNTKFRTVQQLTLVSCFGSIMSNPTLHVIPAFLYPRFDLCSNPVETSTYAKTLSS